MKDKPSRFHKKKEEKKAHSPLPNPLSQVAHKKKPIFQHLITQHKCAIESSLVIQREITLTESLFHG